MPTHTLGELLKKQMSDTKISKDDIRNNPQALALAKAAQEQNELNKKKSFK